MLATTRGLSIENYWNLIALFCFLGVLYPSYIYPLILSFIPEKKLQQRDNDFYKSIKISLIIVFKNEVLFLKSYKDQYLHLLQSLPNLNLIFINDGSSDESEAILENIIHERLHFLSYQESLGKNQRIREYLRDKENLKKEHFLAFSDGNTHLIPEALIQMLNAFEDPGVGCSSSILEYNDGFRFEGTYWNNENRIKSQESLIHQQGGATGALFAIRVNTYQEQNDNFPIDLAFSLNALLSGYSSISIYKSRVFEEIEQKNFAIRKHRTLLRGMYCAFFYLPKLIQKKRYVSAFCLISHKIIRWLNPVFILLMLLNFSYFSFTLILLIGLAFFPYSPLYLIGIFWSCIRAFFHFVFARNLKKW
ncbi:glycosyltransferase [bacterium]|nr:glycosyltransferase [bacterium]